MDFLGWFAALYRAEISGMAASGLIAQNETEYVFSEKGPILI